MSWHYNDLTAATGAPLAVFRPMGYMLDSQSTQHIICRGFDGHIHELWWDSNGWHHNDLTAAAGAPLAFEAPWGHVFAAQGTQHVVYLGVGAGGQVDGHIHELWWDSNGWHHNDLTAATGAPTTGGNLTGNAFFAQGTKHIFYLPSWGGTDDHIRELWWDSNGWHDNDLTVAAGAPLFGIGDLRSYLFAGQGNLLGNMIIQWATDSSPRAHSTSFTGRLTATSLNYIGRLIKPPRRRSEVGLWR